MAARVAPSSVPAPAGVKYQATVKANLGERLSLAERTDMSRVGSAIHAFLGMETAGVADDSRHSQAAALLDRWGMADVLNADQLVIIQKRLQSFIKANYPDAILRTEWPIMIQQENHQLTQGWIDLLLELPDGYVVIDHKSYPGIDIQSLADRYAGQLGVYRQALEASSDKPVLASLLHLPLLGKVVSIERVGA